MHSFTAHKIPTALLMTLKISTLRHVNAQEGYEYPVSGDALALLTAPGYVSKSIWVGVVAK